jgi:selenide,water dikinase
MTAEQMEKRRRIMRRSIALGHCVCDPQKPCPCPVFKEHDVCECAGERMPMPAGGTIRLTEHVRAAGCASKIGKKDLRAILSALPAVDDSRVVVGSAAGDDAAVLHLHDGAETVLTVDVFAPSVDDAFTFGRIAAANSLSDIYAMGATPQAALSVVGFPIHTLPGETMGEILRGGVETMNAAGVPVVGGHSINDAEVKCGFAVLGTAPRGGSRTHAGAQAGDALVLTKPVGGGIVLFGNQVGRAEAEAVEAVTRGMCALNREAGAALAGFDAHAATDVTGFSLLGHLVEIAVKSGVVAEIDFAALPVYPGARTLCRADALPGAVERNREAVSPDLLDLAALTPAQQAVLFSPETSGGLLVALAADRAEDYLQRLHEQGVADAAIIGRFTEPSATGFIRVHSNSGEDWSPQPLDPLPAAAESPAKEEEPEDAACCCGGAADQTTSTDAGDETASCCGGGPPTDADPAGGIALPTEVAARFKAFMAAANSHEALTGREAALINVALSVATRCEPCLGRTIEAARTAGADEAAIGEAAALGVAFGGAPSKMMTAGG